MPNRTSAPCEGPDLLTLGEPLISLTAERGRLVHSRDLTKSIGGAEVNVAIGLARLGLRARFLGRVGADPFGDEIVNTLRGEGVDTTGVTRSPTAPTGMMVKERFCEDAVSVFYYRSASAATEMGEDSAGPEEASPRHVFVTGITLALGHGPTRAVQELVTRASDWQASVSFDPNFRLKLTTLDAAVTSAKGLLGSVDHLLLSESEALAITGASTLEQAMTDLAGAVEHVVIRRGLLGAVGTAGASRNLVVPAFSVGPAVDSVGAGDAFTAGYLYEMLCGGDFAAALQTGAWAAGHVVAHRGDYEGLPFRSEYDAWRLDEASVFR